MNFENYVYLAEDSPTGLRWTYEGGKGRGKHYKGDIAGVMQQNQSYRIWLNGHFYKVHRIIYEMYNKTKIKKGYVIDHINGNPFDNRVDNLRQVTRKENSRNMKVNKNNKTGITGVSFDNKREGHRYVVAQWRDVEGRHCKKSFPIKKHGEETAFNLAKEYRDSMILEVNSHGEKYSPRHMQLIENNVKRG